MDNTNNANLITSGSLNPVPTTQTVPAPQDTTNYTGIVGGVTDSIANDYAGLNKKVQQGQELQSQTGTDIVSLMNELTGKTEYTQKANELAGVNSETAKTNALVEQLAGLNSQASMLNRESQAIPLITQENNRNTGATDAGIAPQNAGALRLNAIKALSIAQQADIATAALTGSQVRLQAAKDKVQQIVDLKYKPIEETIALKQKQYDLNKDILDSYDKKRSEALQVALTKEANQLATAKENEKASSTFVLNAIQGNAPAELIAKAQDLIKKGAKSTDVANLLGQFSLSSADKLDMEFKRASIDEKRANAAKTRAEIAKLAEGTGTPAKDLPLIIKKSEDKISKIQSLINNDKGLAASAGTFKRAAFLSNSIKDWRSDIKNVLADLTVDELGRIKASGVTFGALSDGERELVGAAASSLTSAANKDKNGNLTGYFDISEDKVKQELKTIQDYTKIDFERRTGMKYDDYVASQTPQVTKEDFWSKVDATFNTTSNIYQNAGYDTGAGTIKNTLTK